MAVLISSAYKHTHSTISTGMLGEALATCLLGVIGSLDMMYGTVVIHDCQRALCSSQSPAPLYHTHIDTNVTWHKAE
jgi:hypothetical protein